MQDKEHLLSTLGLCARARALVVGTPLLCETLRAGNGRILCVLEASDTSANTHKRLTDKCTYYRVPLHRLEADAGTLGRAVGKTGAVAAVGIRGCCGHCTCRRQARGARTPNRNQHSRRRRCPGGRPRR